MKIELTLEEITLVKEILETKRYTYMSSKLTADGIIEKLVPKPKVKKPVVLKTYMFNFIGGGWNTVYAKTKRGAIKEVKRIYGEIKSIPDYDSVRLCSQDTYNQLCSMSR
jgi:hypothetical protein